MSKPPICNACSEPVVTSAHPYTPGAFFTVCRNHSCDHAAQGYPFGTGWTVDASEEDYRDSASGWIRTPPEGDPNE